MPRIRVAFVKFSGLASGGTERWLQMIAASLPRDQFDVDYFYCDAAPYIGSNFRHPDTDPDRLRYMEDQGVNLIRFRVAAKDMNTPTHDWLGTDFWEKFEARGYDFVQTGKAGPAEYPYYLMEVPVVECVTLSAGVDSSPNVAWSFQLSPWQRREWIAAGGDSRKSSIVPVPVLAPSSAKNLRNELGIPRDALVAGLHQRADDGIFSPIPLEAFARVCTPDLHFVLMGGSSLYQKQAASLGLTNIHFVRPSGNAVRISEFLNSLDIFAHGRRDGETFGTVLAEAMIHGVPCLSHPSLIGNNNAQVETMGPGGLYAQGRDEYAAMLQALFHDEALRKKLSWKAKSHAAQYYSLRSCVGKVADTYRLLAGLDGQTAEMSVRHTYEYSPRGYLQVGAQEDPRGIANHDPEAGAFAQFEIDLVRQVLPQMKIVVDIGARNGPLCLVAAKEIDPAGRVIAYETRPECLADLHEAAYLNNWEDRLLIRAIALGARAGRVPAQAPRSRTGSDSASSEDGSAPSEMIALDTLDNQLEELRLDRLDLLRIRGRPSELMGALEGAVGAIGKYSPVLLLGITDASIQTNRPGKGGTHAITWVRDHGYAVYECRTDLPLGEIRPKMALLTSGSYLCFRSGLHTLWKKQIRSWALRRQIWRLFWHPRVAQATTCQRKLGRLSKAIQNPRAAIGSLTARAVPGHQNHARGGHGSSPRTGRPNPKP